MHHIGERKQRRPGSGGGGVGWRAEAPLSDDEIDLTPSRSNRKFASDDLCVVVPADRHSGLSRIEYRKLSHDRYWARDLFADFMMA